MKATRERSGGLGNGLALFPATLVLVLASHSAALAAGAPSVVFANEHALKIRFSDLEGGLRVHICNVSGKPRHFHARLHGFGFRVDDKLVASSEVVKLRPPKSSLPRKHNAFSLGKRGETSCAAIVLLPGDRTPDSGNYDGQLVVGAPGGSSSGTSRCPVQRTKTRSPTLRPSPSDWISRRTPPNPSQRQ
jgi:hypothetical protein